MDKLTNMRIRIEERDTKLANQADVIRKLEQSRRDLRKDNARLLAVARAAAGLCAVERNQYETCYVPEIEPFIDELDTALAAVEDLL